MPRDKIPALRVVAEFPPGKTKYFPATAVYAREASRLFALGLTADQVERRIFGERKEPDNGA